MINQKGIRKSKITRTCLLFLMVILAVSCESFPRPKSASDTLLIIPVSCTNTSTAPWLYSYSLKFEGLSQPVLVYPSNLHHYIAVSGLPAGSYKWKTITFNQLASTYREIGQSENTFDAPAATVEIKEGTATMAPFLLEITVVSVSGSSFQQSLNIRQVLDADKKTISDELRNEPALNDWKNGFGAFQSAKTTDFFELVKTGTPEDIQGALNKGANVNAQDNNGLTPLMYAAMNNKNPEVITTLLKVGADLEDRDKNGGTVLIYASSYNQNPEVIIVLLNAGADINAQDKNGGTPLMYAARNNQNPEVIATLLKAGANAKTKDSAGKTAFDYVQGNEKLKGTDALRQLQEASQ